MSASELRWELKELMKRREGAGLTRKEERRLEKIDERIRRKG